MWSIKKIHHPILVLSLTSHAKMHNSVFLNKSNQSDKNKRFKKTSECCTISCLSKLQSDKGRMLAGEKLIPFTRV